jgi:hypothetical protein
LTRGDLDPREEPPTEGPRQGADGKEKRRVGRHPAVALDVKGATGNDAVQVDVVAQLLIPCVEDREEAQLAAQMMARIGPKREERVGDRLEEDLIQDGLVGEDERVEIVGHGENGVKDVTPRPPHGAAARGPGPRGPPRSSSCRALAQSAAGGVERVRRSNGLWTASSVLRVTWR